MNNPIQRSLITLVTILLFLQSGNGAGAEPKLIDDFSQELRPGWQVKEFQGMTSYRLTVEDNIPCLKAESNGTASGLFYEIEYDPRQYPVLTWKWKVDDIIAQGDATNKAGDDYAARIYVVFPSFFFWKTRSLNYIWANRLLKGEAIPSSFTSNSMMVAVESGRQNIGKWTEHRRNIYEDFEKYFGRTPPMVNAIAIMTDTDNTGRKASACYGPIYIDSAEKNAAPRH
jgi:hypothetical protein